MKKLVVITAGLTQPSSTRLLADRLAAATVRAAGPATPLDVRVVELRDLAHDVMNHMLLGFPPPALEEVLTAVEGADGLIAVTPTFNASYSGLFKSFFDVLGDEALVDKPVLLGATGGTARHSLAIDHALRPLFAYLRAAAVPTAVFAASEDWAGDTLRDRIDRAAAELAREIDRREPTTLTDPFELTTTFADLLSS
jgi:FMN reductase